MREQLSPIHRGRCGEARPPSAGCGGVGAVPAVQRPCRSNNEPVRGSRQHDQQHALFLGEQRAGRAPPVGDVAFPPGRAGEDPVELLSLAGVGVEEVNPGADRALVGRGPESGAEPRSRPGAVMSASWVMASLTCSMVSTSPGIVWAIILSRACQRSRRWHAGQGAADQVDDCRVLDGQVPLRHGTEGAAKARSIAPRRQPDRAMTPTDAAGSARG